MQSFMKIFSRVDVFSLRYQCLSYPELTIVQYGEPMVSDALIAFLSFSVDMS